ncbi:MAG: hypothetical protein R3E13_11170 [Alphaproteobacteria bacterium]
MIERKRESCGEMKNPFYMLIELIISYVKSIFLTSLVFSLCALLLLRFEYAFIYLFILPFSFFLSLPSLVLIAFPLVVFADFMGVKERNAWLLTGVLIACLECWFLISFLGDRVLDFLSSAIVAGLITGFLFHRRVYEEKKGLW